MGTNLKLDPASMHLQYLEQFIYPEITGKPAKVTVDTKDSKYVVAQEQYANSGGK